ncbi:MAG: hypothetical protein M3Q98_10285 [Actinomycetota bacterium]|nr:hypothetical protein [Actinomycetota bacterium]
MATNPKDAFDSAAALAAESVKKAAGLAEGAAEVIKTNVTDAAAEFVKGAAGIAGAVAAKGQELLGKKDE